MTEFTFDPLSGGDYYDQRIRWANERARQLREQGTRPDAGRALSAPEAPPIQKSRNDLILDALHRQNNARGTEAIVAAWNLSPERQEELAEEERKYQQRLAQERFEAEWPSTVEGRRAAAQEALRVKEQRDAEERAGRALAEVGYEALELPPDAHEVVTADEARWIGGYVESTAPDPTSIEANLAAATEGEGEGE